MRKGMAAAALMLGIFCVAYAGVHEESDSDQISSSPRESGKDNSAAYENAWDSWGTNQDNEAGGETDQNPTDPTVDHVRSDNCYYRIIEDRTIDDPYFTMDVPESFAGQVRFQRPPSCIWKYHTASESPNSKH